MRARKLAVMTAEEDMPPSEEGADTWLASDEPVVDRGQEAGPISHLCLACGTADEEGATRQTPCDCREPREIVRLEAPSRAVRDAVARLRRAGAEQRAAARALRALVLTEVARGRGDLEAPARLVDPCPRCLIRDAEAAAAASGVTRPARKPKGERGQQALPFKGT